MDSSKSPALIQEDSSDTKLPALREQRINEIARSINLADPTVTVTYGAETMREISRFADDLLSRVKVKDSGQVGEILTGLMQRVKEVDAGEIAKRPSPLSKLPIIGSLFTSMDKVMNRFRTVAGQIEVITDKLGQAMAGLLYDNEVLEKLYEHNETFHYDLTEFIEAGKRRLEHARDVELPELTRQAETSQNPMEAQKLRDFAEQINRFERRLHDLQLSRTITVQTAPQIRLIQSNNRTLAEKIQTSILSTIPIWKSQMVVALSLHGQKNAAELQKSVTDTTNAMLRKNAEMLETASIETAREVERSVVSVDTLREVHNRLINTIEETLQIAEQGRSSRRAAEQELASMETELKERIASLAARKSQQSLEAAAGTTRPALKSQQE